MCQGDYPGQQFRGRQAGAWQALWLDVCLPPPLPPPTLPLPLPVLRIFLRFLVFPCAVTTAMLFDAVALLPVCTPAGPVSVTALTSDLVRVNETHLVVGLADGTVTMLSVGHEHVR